MATSEGERAGIEKAHIGTMGWSYPFWIGSLYPIGLKPTGFLAEYAKHFNSVELDNTFYRIPSAKMTQVWKEQTPDGFLFSAKFPRMITHIKVLQDCEGEVKAFISRMSSLQNRLGPLLLQFPSSFTIKQFALLEEFLPTLPLGLRYAVEVRSKSLLTEKLYTLLRENGVALALVTEPFPEYQLTADFVYFRWEGDRRKVSGTLGKVEVDRTEDISKWAKHVKNLLYRKKQIFGYFSKYYSGYPPADAMQLLHLLL